MENLFVILHVFILFLFIAGLFVMQKKHVSFSKRVFTALGLGIVFGFALQLIYGPASHIVTQTADWFNIAGGGYVKLLQMIVMPLVFISILGAFTKLKLTHNIGKISGLIIGILIATTAIAAAVGIVSALSFDLKAVHIDQGSTELSRGQELQQKSEDMTAKTLPQQIVELLPGNPFLDFTGARPTSTIGVVIFAAFLGIAFLGVKRKQPEHAATFSGIVDAVYAIIMRVVTLILRLTPYGVLAIMTKTIATSDIDSIAKLGMFVIASYAALIAMFIIHLLLITFSGLNPITYVKKAFPVMVFAFTSRSSAGALPLNIKTQKSMGVPEGIANFAGSFGLSIGQNGCAGIYPAMLAMMIAPTVGQNPFEPGFIISVIAIVAISSFGVAGVGGGATFAALLVLSSLNMPVALAGLLISIEPLIDMGRTALNVSGSMTAGLLTSKMTKETDTAVYNDSSIVIEAEEA
ncbi:L-cystine transporter [Bacillus velezensis]|uniref:L-cystine transporter n=1 Tax=Bacillus TaxID=1386 RepID=UPI000F0150E2|nr:MULTISPECIES: L-cystine transporter [Bacillus amyloliquefaciens group]MEC1383206.1 L-cystine transporter [Bacillus velezensis]MEC2354903.1 L-cystine transporter [Bacillus velezensis]MEC3668531.1 L-cystine transporter [Bacillus velezensis]MED3399635.1 L-cystine transporter [Bacillus velezensis]MED3656740.1 L-cystine transporter [Bacillus velezensis]